MFQIIAVISFLISLWLSHKLKSKFQEFSRTKLRTGMSGREVAEKMLRENFVYDVKVISVDGQLTDHYNPVDKTVNLSHDVYHGCSVASAAVAAHECGHAVQHAKGYLFLTFRSMMVPAVSFASRLMPIIIFAGFLTIKAFPVLLELGIILFAITTLFTLITLPVEFDASNRALEWIDATRLVDGEEYSKAKSALSWAAATYIIAAVGSVANLLHMISVYNRNRD